MAQLQRNSLLMMHINHSSRRNMHYGMAKESTKGARDTVTVMDVFFLEHILGNTYEAQYLVAIIK